MLVLALEYGRGQVLLKDISQRENVSEKYLGQIVIALKAKGLVSSFRGAKGGYVLAKKPADVSVYEIVRALEGDYNLVECINNPAQCERVSHCLTRDLWHDLEFKIKETLEDVKLSDLVAKAKKKISKQITYNI